MVQARHGGDLPRGPGAADHQQAGLVALHGQQLAGSLVRHDGPQQVLGLLQRSHLDQIVVRRGAVEVDVEIIRRQRGRARSDPPTAPADRSRNARSPSRRVRCAAQSRSLPPDPPRRARAPARRSRARCVWPRSRISSAMLRISSGCACAWRSATKLPTPAMRTRTPSSRNSFRARLAVMRDTPNDLDDLVLGGHAGRRAPPAGVDVVENVPLHLEVQRLQSGGGLRHRTPKLKLYIQVQSTH